MFLKLHAVFSLFLYAAAFLASTLLASSISRITDIGNLFDFKRFLAISVILSSVLILASPRQLRGARLQPTSIVALLTFFILGMISAIYSAKPYWGMVELANCGLLLIAFFTCCICMNYVSKRSLFRGVYIFVAAFSLLFLMQFVIKLLIHMLEAKKPGMFSLISGFDNPRILNQLQVMLLPLLLLPFITLSLAKYQRLSVFLMAIHWMAMIQTEARGAILSLTLAGALVLYFNRAADRKTILKPLAQSILVGLALWAVLIVVIPYLLIGETNLRFRTGSSGRAELWLYALNSIRDNFWLGLGPMSFAWAEGKPLFNAHPHNSSLQILYEYGFLVFLVLLIWVTRALHIALKKIDSDLHRETDTVVLFSILSALCYSQLSGVIVMPITQLMLVFLIALYHYQSNTCNVSIKMRWVIPASALLLATFIYSTYEHQQLQHLKMPRLWQHGLISPK